MLNRRFIFTSTLLVISLAISACTPSESPATEPTVEAPTAAVPTTTLEPIVTPTEPIPTDLAPETITATSVGELSPLASLALPTSINRLVFTPNSATLAASTPSGVGLFDIATAQQTNTLVDGVPIWNMAFSADNLELAVIPSEQGMPPVIWDLAANAPAALMAGQLESVSAIGFSADHTMLATGSQTGIVNVYHLESDTPPLLWSVDINTAPMVADLQFGTPIPVTDVVFSPDGTQLAASSAGLGVLVIYNISGAAIDASGSAMNHIAGPVATALLAPNDWSKFYWLSRGSVIAVDLATDQELGMFSHEDFIQGVAFSADGTVLATSSGATIDGTFQPVITLWDTSNYTILRQITGFAQIPPALAFSPDGTLLAVGTNGEGIAVWGLAQSQ